MSFLNKLFGASDANQAKATANAAKANAATAIKAAEARARIDGATPPFLLDVREPHEYREGHIAGARLIPLGELGRRLNELPRDRDILVICRSGNRSGAATRQLVQSGYRAINLSGGMIGWQRAGFPSRRGK